MWAGSRFDFAGALAVGMDVERCSTIEKVTCKSGRSGPLIFVTVSHRISEKGGRVLVTEEHDIVYRSLDATAAKTAEPFQSTCCWERKLVPDTVMLFRFSALTFNGHRIHYDRDYARAEEGYPGLVVHGPLLGMLLLDLARRNNPDSQITHFEFRALAPVFEGQPLTLKGLEDPEQPQKATLWCENQLGGRTMKARIHFA
jgi:3-methylfumaryl-CoA hydratase